MSVTSPVRPISRTSWPSAVQHHHAVIPGVGHVDQAIGPNHDVARALLGLLEQTEREPRVGFRAPGADETAICGESLDAAVAGIHDVDDRAVRREGNAGRADSVARAPLQVPTTVRCRGRTDRTTDSSGCEPERVANAHLFRHGRVGHVPVKEEPESVVPLARGETRTTAIVPKARSSNPVGTRFIHVARLHDIAGVLHAPRTWGR